MTNEMLTDLQGGTKLRRPSWPVGDYIEAEGTGSDRKVAPGTLLYISGGQSRYWVAMATYDSDFGFDDFVIVT